MLITRVGCCGLFLVASGVFTVAQTKTEPKDAVIERTPLILRDPASFQTPLHLDAIQQVDLAAVVDGTVGAIQVKVGDTAKAQAEALRMDANEADLVIKRAQAAIKAAEAEVTSAETKFAGAAQAKVDVAKVDLEIAEFKREQLIVKAPFTGKVLRIHVVPGQFVKAGTPLITVADPSKLVVEVPVDRATVKVGDTLEIKVEDKSASVKIDALLPLNPRFESLRDLFLSVASARAIVDNSSGKYDLGQTVYSAMIPRHPVCEVPISSLSNTDEGGRKAQVIRDGMVRDVIIQPLGQIGEERIFVSGSFSNHDELVIKSSEILLDGARLVPRAGEAAGRPSDGNTPPGSTNKAPGGNVPMPNKPKAGF